MRKNRDEIVAYINNLKGYEGYVQFSNRAIADIWTTPSDISIELNGGFIYEAHFCNDEHSICIRQINHEWIVSTTPFSEVDDKQKDIEVYFVKDSNVKMAQIWKEESDELCEGMSVKKLKKVVFAGFVGGER
jgi:CRISPR type III-associated protein (TIGR04423 family)